MYLNCLIHIVCMNLFCYYIYFILYISIHAIVGTNVLKLSSFVKMSRRTQFCGTSLDVENFSKGFMCLSTSGNYTQFEILTGNS